MHGKIVIFIKLRLHGTMHTESTIHEAWGAVEIVPVWKWLVG
ncbi:MAG TPA: hypothetical protein PK029_01795 [Bacteroidales bacterium]|nr:hypothetical protein [Bacteroidales bacterium]